MVVAISLRPRSEKPRLSDGKGANSVRVWAPAAPLARRPAPSHPIARAYGRAGRLVCGVSRDGSAALSGPGTDSWCEVIEM
jgi:hypothetical protein